MYIYVFIGQNNYIKYCFQDSRSLDVYEIIHEVLHITSSHNKSQANVKIVFKRRVEYHVGHTFFEVTNNTCKNMYSKNANLSFNVSFNWWFLIFTDFSYGYYWLFILLLWNWKNLRQSYCCIDNNSHFINCDFINSGCKYLI